MALRCKAFPLFVCLYETREGNNWVKPKCFSFHFSGDLNHGIGRTPLMLDLLTQWLPKLVSPSLFEPAAPSGEHESSPPPWRVWFSPSSPPCHLLEICMFWEVMAAEETLPSCIFYSFHYKNNRHVLAFQIYKRVLHNWMCFFTLCCTFHADRSPFVQSILLFQKAHRPSEWRSCVKAPEGAVCHRPRWLSHGHLMGSFFSPVGVFISVGISFRAVSGLTDSSSPISAFYRTGCSERLSSFSNITALRLHCRSWAMTQVAESPAPFFFLLYCSVLESFPSSLKCIPSPLKIPTNTAKQINANLACGKLYKNISYYSVYINIKLPLLCSNSKAEKIVAVNPYFCQVLKNRTKEKYIIPNFW